MNVLVRALMDGTSDRYQILTLEHWHRCGAAVFSCRREKNPGNRVAENFGLGFELFDKIDIGDVTVLIMTDDHVKNRIGHPELREELFNLRK